MDTVDAERLQRWSNDEPVLLLFVGMTVDEFNGTYSLSRNAYFLFADKEVDFFDAFAAQAH